MNTININMEQVLSGASIPLEIERWIMGNGIKVMHVIDNPDHDRVSCLYCPPFLTSDPGNH